jgi:hypothetical protein
MSSIMPGIPTHDQASIGEFCQCIRIFCIWIADGVRTLTGCKLSTPCGEINAHHRARTTGFERGDHCQSNGAATQYQTRFVTCQASFVDGVVTDGEGLGQGCDLGWNTVWNR